MQVVPPVTDNPANAAFIFIGGDSTLAKPILSPISVFDANQGTTAYFKVATTYDTSLRDAALKNYNAAVRNYDTVVASIKTRGVEYYGNINNITRARIIWTSENISKYQTFVDEMNKDETVIQVGDYSTVLGCDDKIDTLQIAWTPLFQTDSGDLIPLTTTEMNKYLDDVKVRAVALSGGFVAENILSVDSNGITETVNGSSILVKNMIAAVEGAKFDGAALTACDVSAIAGWSESELKKEYNKTSVFVGWSMHDVQDRVWAAKDNVTEKKELLDKATPSYCYEIYDSSTNALVGTETGPCDNYSFESGYEYKIIPRNWLVNQLRNYSIRVKVRFANESDYGEFSDLAVLWCKEKPVLRFDGLSADSENLIFTSTITFLLKYEYVPSQNEALSTYRYYIYDENKNLIDGSAIYYGSISNSFAVNSLSNETVFFARGTGTTRNGYNLDTGYIRIQTKYYADANSIALLQCKNNYQDGYISISSHLVGISGHSSSEIKYTPTSNGFVADLTNGEKVVFDIPYQISFYNAPDWVLIFRVSPIIRKNLVEFVFDQDGIIYSGYLSTNIRAIKTEESSDDKFYALFKIVRDDGGYAYSDIYTITSNLITVPSNDVLLYLKRNNGSFEITAREVIV